MKDFNYCAPTRVIFGKNTELEVGKALKNADTITPAPTASRMMTIHAKVLACLP